MKARSNDIAAATRADLGIAGP